MHIILRIAVSLTVLAICSCLPPTSYLSPSDKNHLKSVLDKAWTLTDLSQVCHAVVGYKLLKLEVPDKTKVCQYIKKSVEGKPTPEQLYYASYASKTLACPITAPSGTKQTLNDIKEETDLINVFFAVSALKNLGLEVDEPKVLKAIQYSMKKDDSILNLGYAFHVGAQLKADTSSIFSKTEDVIMQADEVDGQMLQFEGGLSITAFILSGVYKLAETSKKPIPMKKEQVIKFSNYLMSRKTIQLPKGAYYMLDAVNILTNNKFHIPVSITLASSIAVSPDSPKIQIRVTNLMGDKLDKLKVIGVSATEDETNKAIFSNKAFKQVSGDASLYEVDVMSAKPSRGFYQLSINVEGSDARLVGNLGTTVTFKVLSAVSVQNIEIGTADVDQTSQPVMNTVTYPATLSTAIHTDYHQRLVLRFKVTDTYTSQATKVHQAFVKISSGDSLREIIFVAEPDTSGVYKFEMDVNANKKEFGAISGKYSLELVLGDASISNSMVWKIADVVLKFSEDSGVTKSETVLYKAQPEIEHMFREPDPKPAKVVSLAFTALCLSPLLLLVVGWLTVGVNMKNFPFSLSSIGFHVGMGAIFGLFCLFWLQLNMFTTLRYLIALSIITFLCGNSMLASIAEKRKDK